MLNKLRDEIHQNAKEHGWWKEERGFGEIIALCHSELSEALEEYRNGVPAQDIYYTHPKTKEIYFADEWDGEGKPEGIATELADCIIRILDYCGKENIDIEKAISIKHDYNKTRPYRHGGKVI
jgi:NTP pyrophosphatase (non-canonical NTP hydrolase)